MTVLLHGYLLATKIVTRQVVTKSFQTFGVVFIACIMYSCMLPGGLPRIRVRLGEKRNNAQGHFLHATSLPIHAGPNSRAGACK